MVWIESELLIINIPFVKIDKGYGGLPYPLVVFEKGIGFHDTLWLSRRFTDPFVSPIGSDS